MFRAWNRYEAFYAEGIGKNRMFECCDIGKHQEVIGNIFENPELVGAK